MSGLNKLQSFIVTDLELAYTIARKREEFDSYYKFQKWAVDYIKANVRGRMPTRSAQRHIDWIEFYIVPRPNLWKKGEYLKTAKYTKFDDGS